jgi:hypothetical protein
MQITNPKLNSLKHMNQDEQGMFSVYGSMASLEGLNKKQYSFKNKEDVYDIAQAFLVKFEEQEIDFPMHPPFIKKYLDTDKESKILSHRANGKVFIQRKLKMWN